MSIFTYVTCLLFGGQIEKEKPDHVCWNTNKSIFSWLKGSSIGDKVTGGAGLMEPMEDYHGLLKQDLGMMEDASETHSFNVMTWLTHMASCQCLKWLNHVVSCMSDSDCNRVRSCYHVRLRLCQTQIVLSCDHSIDDSLWVIPQLMTVCEWYDLSHGLTWVTNMNNSYRCHTMSTHIRSICMVLTICKTCWQFL